MKIYNAKNILLLDVVVDDSSCRYRAIMGDHTLTLRYALAEHCELPVGAYCVFQGQRYTLERPEDFKMVSSRNFDYTVVFQSTEYKTRIWKFRNPVDGRLKFSLTAKPKEHLQMFVDNMNRRDTGWTVGNCIEGAEVCINYDHDFCRDALARIATELKTEYHFNGKTVSLGKLEVNKDHPLPLSYGRGNGFKSGVGRTNSGDNPPTEILYVQGGTDNIDRSVYPPLNEERVRAASAGCLLLPRLASLRFDGDHFEDEDGFNAETAHTYVTDDLGLSLRRADKELSSLAEDSLDCSSIYPKRVGTVSEVIDVKGDGTVWDIVDNTIPESLNFEDCIIGEETMSIIFQSGMLAGKEFDVKYCHNATNINGNAKKGRRFEIVPQEIDGLNMPGDCFVPVKGDTYAVFHCNLPQSYINVYTGNAPEKKGAEWDMFRMAVKHLYDAEQLHFTFSGVLDGIWAKKDWVNIGGRIVLGGYVLFTDPQFEKDGARVRITGIKDYVNNPHSPEIELSNSAISASVSTTLKELAAEDVTVQENHRDALQFTRRRFRDAQETMSLIEKALLANFSESINPVAVHTIQMLVGDESLQFEFVDRFPVEGSNIKPQTVNHIVKWDNATRTLNVPEGIIRHLTLDLPKDLSSEVAPTTYHYWEINNYRSRVLDNPSQQYYLYARVLYNGKTGEFRLIEATVPQLPHFRTGNEVWMLMGVLNSEYGGERSYASLYGFTEILPGRITTDRVVSGDGQSWFDMSANSMQLGDRLSFNKNGDGQLLLRGTLVQSQSGDTEYIGCFRGEYDPNVTYFQGDEVTYLEETTATVSTYRCIVTSCKGVPPTTSTSWQVIAQGSQGYSPACVYRGEYSQREVYIGTPHRVDAVKADDGKCYVARTDSGEFKDIAPPDPSKWNDFGGNFESIATNLLLAENANIGGWLFRNNRLESESRTSNGEPIAFLDGKDGKCRLHGIMQLSTAYTGNISDANIFFLPPQLSTKDVTMMTGADQVGKVVRLFNSGKIHKRDANYRIACKKWVTSDHTTTISTNYYAIVRPQECVELTCFETGNGNAEWEITSRFSFDNFFSEGSGGRSPRIWCMGRVNFVNIDSQSIDGKMWNGVNISDIMSVKRNGKGDMVLTFPSGTFPIGYKPLVQGYGSMTIDARVAEADDTHIRVGLADDASKNDGSFDFWIFDPLWYYDTSSI